CAPAEDCDATDRAVAVARRNGFDVNDTADSVKVVTAAVSGQTNELQVTVSRAVPTLFARIFGVTSFTVSQTAVASYLPPISLGQSGGQIGSAVSQLGTGSAFYFMREFGYSANRHEGDAFSPNPSDLGTLSPPSTDVHQFSGPPPAGAG